MRITRTFTALAAVAALGLVVTGCSNSGSGKDGKLSWEDSPLQKYWSAMYGGSDMTPEEQQAQMNEQQKKIEEAVAQCMTDEGFEYTPNDFSSSGSSIAMGDDNWRPDDRDWVEKYGYGFINGPWQEEQGGETEPPTEEPYVDPNSEYVQSLSESEQAAYNIALWGDQTKQEPTIDSEGNEVYEYNWEEGGCYGKAQHEHSGQAGYDELQKQYSDLIESMSNLYTTIEESDAMVALNTKWSTCMTEAGFDFKKRNDAQDSIIQLQNEMYEKYTEADYSKGDPTEKDREEIGKKEIEVALADLTCREKSNFTEEQFKIQFAEEQKFIDANKSELDKLAAAAAQINKKK